MDKDNGFFGKTACVGSLQLPLYQLRWCGLHVFGWGALLTFLRGGKALDVQLVKRIIESNFYIIH
jgi:hypothetical protein